MRYFIYSGANMVNGTRHWGEHMQQHDALGHTRRVDDPSNPGAGWMKVTSDSFNHIKASLESQFDITEVDVDGINGKLKWDQIAADERRQDAMTMQERMARLPVTDAEVVDEINAAIAKCDAEQTILDGRWADLEG